MYGKFIIIILILAGFNANAGTGHAKDLDLAYIIVLILFAIVIGIWNGIDFLRKNGIKIRSQIISIKEKLLQLISSILKEFSGNYIIH